MHHEEVIDSLTDMHTWLPLRAHKLPCEPRCSQLQSALQRGLQDVLLQRPAQ